MAIIKIAFQNAVFAVSAFWGLILLRKSLAQNKMGGLVVVLVLTLFPLMSLLHKGTYESGDLSINAIKTMAFYKSLQEGNLLPRWAGELNATYGYPLFLFTYPLPYYLAAAFHGLGLSFIDSVKAVMATAFIGSSLFMYFLCRQHKTQQLLAVLVTILYVFAPYHLVDLHFRVNIGELLAFAFIPLIFLALEGKRFKLGILALAGLILSHQAIALVILPWVFIYRRTRKVFGIIILALGLTTFYWLPVIWEARFTHQPEFARQVIFWPASSYIYSPWRWGLLFQGPNGELVFPIGYVQIGLVLWGLKRGLKFGFWVGSFVVFMFLILPISQPIWPFLPLLTNIQFSYRLMVVVSFIVAMWIMHLYRNYDLKPFLIWGLIGMAIFPTILNWTNRRVIPEIDDYYLQAELPLSTARGEGLHPAASRWTNSHQLWQTELPKTHLEILSGKAKIKDLPRTNVSHRYVVNVEEDAVFLENTLFFPGWTLYIDQQLQPFDLSSDGVIKFSMTKGLHIVELTFLPTPVRNISIIISIIALTAYLLYVAI